MNRWDKAELMVLDFEALLRVARVHCHCMGETLLRGFPQLDTIIRKLVTLSKLAEQLSEELAPSEDQKHGPSVN